MKKVIVYFHGFGSHANGDKSLKLKAAGFTVHGWDIDIDNSISIPYLTKQLDDMFVDYLHQEVDFVFMGTSLGAWYANYFGKVFNVRTLLINPAFSPADLLPRLGVDPSISRMYMPIEFTENDTVVLAKDDELIDFSGVDFSGANLLRVYPTGGHRFSGPEFDHLVSVEL